MSTKKSFSISPGLASGLRSSIQSASTNHGQLHYDMMLIDAIEPDPSNPRKLSITKQEILHGLDKSASNYERKIKEFNDLNDLAESIKKVGVRNAIEVYKDDIKYRIISGERRYLASILAGQKYIPVRINQKLDEFKLRYIQWVENINRQDLSLWERYNNLISMAAAYKQTNSSELDAQVLKDLLGISETQSYRYLCLLKADQEIIDLVKSERLTNLKIIQELVGIKSKSARQSALQNILNSKDDVTSLSKFKKIVKKNKHAQKSINLGKVGSTDAAKYLLSIILADSKINKHKGKFNSIDWTSPQSINKAFKEILNVLEKELASKETVDET